VTRILHLINPAIPGPGGANPLPPLDEIRPFALKIVVKKEKILKIGF